MNGSFLPNIEELQVGIDAWIIQDGNYGDFTAGDSASFALEFFSKSLRSSPQRRNGANHIDKSSYQVCGQVIFVLPHVWVIDFGVKVFCEAMPPKFAIAGSWVEGQVDLGIDPFSYKENLAHEVGMPNLAYAWRIARILRNDCQWMESVGPTGGKMLVRDERSPKWSDVASTDAWNDDNGRAEYSMRIKRL
jgi:hypothetical protein